MISSHKCLKNVSATKPTNVSYKQSFSIVHRLNSTIERQATNYKSRKRCNLITQKLIFIFVITVATYFIRNKVYQIVGAPRNQYVYSPLSRHLLQATETSTESESNTTNHELPLHIEKNCTEPSINEFPTGFFTQEQRSQGSVIIHFLVSLYMFIALAIVCDDYFVPSLEQISEKLKFTEDVAGATFMAAGSSAPELFTSIIGVFVAKGDVGVGTIVGSAVFNILVIIGLCGVCCSKPVALHWWPLMRDSSYYGLSIAVLIVVIYDGAVTWVESLIMLLLYAGYITLMKFNAQAENLVKSIRKKTVRRVYRKRSTTNKMDSEESVKHNSQDSSPMNNEKKIVLTRMNGHTTAIDREKELETALLPTINGNGVTGSIDVENGTVNRMALKQPKCPSSPPMMVSVDEVIFARSRPIGFEEAGLRVMMSSTFAPKTRLRMACKVLIHERQNLLVKNCDDSRSPERVLIRRKTDDNITIHSPAMSEISPTEGDATDAGDIEENDGFTHPLRPPTDNCCSFLKWLLCWPISAAFFFTIPNCSKRRWERWFMVSFFMSTFWIAGCSYIMVWMVVICGYTLNIPDTIMGITFLAAGTSVPDTIASVIVARQGLGDMAVSNSLGSNVFDILLGLAFPWFIKTAIMKYDAVIINSRGLLWSVLLLMTSLFFVICAIHCSGWKLTKTLGFVVLFAYGVFLTFSILIEFNVFFPVNLPMCRD